MMLYIEPIYKALETPKFLEMANFVGQEVNPEEYKPFLLHFSRRKSWIETTMIRIYDY